MRLRAIGAVLLPVLVCLSAFAGGKKTYKHASEFQVGIIDQAGGASAGGDAAAGNASSGGKLEADGDGVHLLHTDAGEYRVEAPENKGASLLAEITTPRHETAPKIRNKWFLDKVQPNTQVLFATKCDKLNKKHPEETKHCNFWFPDPESTDREIETTGSFTPHNDAANTGKIANALCGTGKLNAATEAKLCPPPAAPDEKKGK